MLFDILTEDDRAFDGLDLIGNCSVSCDGIWYDGCILGRLLVVDSDNNEDKDEARETKDSKMDVEGVSLGTVDGNKWFVDALLLQDFCEETVVGKGFDKIIWLNQYRNLFSVFYLLAHILEILSLGW